MELTYRGIKYKSQSLKISHLPSRKKLLKTAIAGNFPLVRYCKQLFFSKNPPVCNVNLFWYQHQIQLLENCWQLSTIDRFNSCWEITSKIELAKALKNNTPVELKYRGVTYYR